MEAKTLFMVAILICFNLALGVNRAQFTVNQCQVDMTCGDSLSLQAPNSISTQGRPGKRGPKGEMGEKGEKGDKCTCVLQNEREVNEIRREISRLTRKVCPQTKYRFPRGGQTSDYIRVKVPIPDLSQVTVCSWITPLPGKQIANSMFSYAIPTKDNALLFWFHGAQFDLRILNVVQTVDFVIVEKTHVCAVVTLPSAKLYVNGALRANFTYPSITSIPGGGTLVVGQEQDEEMGKFDSAQAFSGTVENLMMWNRPLMETEIVSMNKSICGCPTDFAFALTPDVIQLEGKVRALSVDGC